jgi:hypothetical protein
VAGLIRRAVSSGGFGAVLKKGDAERGSILIFLSTRGKHVTCLERAFSLDAGYEWHRVGPPESAGSTQIMEFLASRTRFDEDLWAVELDIADAERFIAETK